MVVAFAGLITADVLEMRQFGVTSAVAVPLDVIVVRMMLVPAMMKLFGKRNWRPGTAIGAAVRP